jgi:hypothetical protein
LEMKSNFRKTATTTFRLLVTVHSVECLPG